MSNAPAAAAPTTAADCKAEIVIGVLVSLIAVAAIIFSQTFPTSGLTTDIGPARFPIFFACALIVLCAMLIGRNLIKLRTLREQAAPVATPSTDKPAVQHHGRIIAGIVASIVNLTAMFYVGYLIASVFYLSFLMWLLGMRHRVFNPLLAIGITAMLYFVFSTGLNVPLPEGSLFE